ncbi:MAG: penicillin-binding protein activator LpoB [Elusimicrobia bacterium]|nr:penicillin-binding protein activator LpoB [Elusimicrobiota bacterium]
MHKYALILLIVISGCAGKKISRLDSGVVIDLSGRWNDTDSQQVADALIEQCLSSGWYSRFAQSSSRQPVVIVGHVANKTMEHIKVQTFTKDLERAMINSGSIQVVASSEERGEVRGERDEMQKWASLETVKDFGKETGADFMLKGVLNSIVDEEGGKKVVYYQADLNLINLESNGIIWAGQKKIKKYIKKPLFKF